VQNSAVLAPPLPKTPPVAPPLPETPPVATVLPATPPFALPSCWSEPTSLLLTEQADSIDEKQKVLSKKLLDLRCMLMSSTPLCVGHSQQRYDERMGAQNS
jgi:hypothetical protein